MTLKERIENLKFYDVGDEDYELFQLTCELSGKMNELDKKEKAETLYLWAKYQAEHSKEWSLECSGSLDKVDFEKGIYG